MRNVGMALAALALASGAVAAEETAPAVAAGDVASTAPASAEKLAAFFGRTKGVTRLVPASDVWEGIASGRSRYFVVDVRPAEDYAKGHVPGALNLPIDVLFRPESLAKLPKPQGGKPLLLVCRSGHTESMALGGLAALGWEPWVLSFGMIGWSAETEVRAGGPAQEPDRVRGVGGPIER
jgi:rhodanese-related sulfurtransferase